ncbi:Transposase [Nonomuraea solani]|uniref:Transposase n=1 Tax=Nonomuraea solani TaxID=1144553 RepID=A0A1H5XSP6_9ACTN|nr:IS5 family transposase [Nonomuraea solani]SEG14698.1 Transposase [Nonomuraea solani]
MPLDRYPSDLSDAQWKLIEPLLPGPNTGGRPEKHPRREIVNAILYVLRSGCPWRYLPTDLPPWQTVYWYFQQWEQAGIIEALLARLRIKVRRQQGRDDESPADVIDLRGAKDASPGNGADGRRWFGLSDTAGLLMVVANMAACG